MTFKQWAYIAIIYASVYALITVILQYPINLLWELLLK
jgi:hypothetical protein